MIKILNLYAGIGGNRKLWPNDEIEVTAVENNPEIAKIYQEYFPNDKVIIADAHQYLLDHYKEFDFIWSSPPCPTHSRTNTFLNAQGVVRYPDMSLWQEIVFLNYWCKVPYVVENVISYYTPLDLHILPQYSGRHYFWCNFNITNKDTEIQNGTFNRKASEFAQEKENMKYMNPNKDWLGFNLKDWKINAYDKRQILRNLVHPYVGLHIFKCAFKEKQKMLTQLEVSKNL